MQPVAGVALLRLAPLARRPPSCADSRGLARRGHDAARRRAARPRPRRASRCRRRAWRRSTRSRRGRGWPCPSFTSMIVLATLRIRYRSWVMSTIVPVKALSASSRTSRDWMSRWLVGSSRQSRLAGSASSFASARRVCSPPERMPTCFSTASPREEERAEQLAHLGGGHHRRGVVQLLEDRVGRVERLDLVLREVRHPHVASPSSRRPALERQHAGEDLEQRRLAGAVRTDERHLLAALEHEVEVAAVDDVVAVALLDVRPA